MTVRDIQGFLAQMHSVDVSAKLISSVTDEVVSAVMAGQSRPLEAMYSVLFFDAMRVKIRSEGVVRNKAIDLALGIQADGSRDILGIWDRKHRGCKVLDESLQRPQDAWRERHPDCRHRWLKGMAEALGAVFPATTLQTCIVHLIRNSLDYASWKDRKPLAAAIKPIYTGR